MHPRLNLGYSERRNLVVVKFRVRRIPIGIEVDPVGIRPEPGDSCSKPIKHEQNEVLLCPAEFNSAWISP